MAKKKRRTKVEMGKIRSKAFLSWRKKQAPGAIMKPETFAEIKQKAKRKYGIGEERASKVAGKAYWATAKAKYRAKALAGRMK